MVVAVVIALTLFHTPRAGAGAVPAARRRRSSDPDDEELRREIRRKAARSGIVSALNLVATLAVLVLAARLVTG